MASDLAMNFADHMRSNRFSETMHGSRHSRRNSSPPPETFNRSRSMDSHNDDSILSSWYPIGSADSRYSNNINLLMRDSNVTQDTGVQNSRVTVVQRSTLAPSPSLDTNGMMYLLAMVLPLVSVNNFSLQWRCTPSTMLNAAEIFLAYLSRFCRVACAYIQRLAQDHIARDLFATAMDIVLVLYAIGFLVLSLYQASIIG